MKKICIIGGSGFVGTRCVDLMKNGYNITIIDKVISCKYPEITIVGDIRDKAFLEVNVAGYDLVVLLAAEHRDDVSPISLYFDVNVNGTQNVLDAMSKNGVENIIFASTVAVYGLNKANPDESRKVEPFNPYGKSKWEAENAINQWFNEKGSRNVTIVRPTVIFGENNRGNVYNLLKQISSGKFMMVGNGNNKKSMAYVGNVVAFIEYCANNMNGLQLFNYIDKPDLTMNELVSQVETSLNKAIPSMRLPYWIGLMGGYAFDLMSKVSGKNFPISSIRVKKFCASTQFDATKVHSSEFNTLFTLNEGLDRTLKSEFE